MALDIIHGGLDGTTAGDLGGWFPKRLAVAASGGGFRTREIAVLVQSSSQITVQRPGNEFS